jgi:hypothetical protein
VGPAVRMNVFKDAKNVLRIKPLAPTAKALTLYAFSGPRLMRGLLLFQVGYYLVENFGKSLTKDLRQPKADIIQYLRTIRGHLINGFPISNCELLTLNYRLKNN